MNALPAGVAATPDSGYARGRGRRADAAVSGVGAPEPVRGAGFDLFDRERVAFFFERSGGRKHARMRRAAARERDRVIAPPSLELCLGVQPAVRSVPGATGSSTRTEDFG